MRILLLSLLMVICCTGCVAYFDEPRYTSSNCIEFEDDFGVRTICDVQYYYEDDGTVVYYDPHFGVWISPRGYWVGGVWHPGYHPGYHNWYHRGFYYRHYHYYHYPRHRRGY